MTAYAVWSELPRRWRGSAPLFIRNMHSEMQDILKRSAQFCKTHGYNMLRIYIDEGDSSYHGNAFSKTSDGGNSKTEYDLSKPIKVTMQDIEKRFGFPVEIVP